MPFLATSPAAFIVPTASSLASTKAVCNSFISDSFTTTRTIYQYHWNNAVIGDNLMIWRKPVASWRLKVYRKPTYSGLCMKCTHISVYLICIICFIQFFTLYMFYTNFIKCRTYYFIINIQWILMIIFSWLIYCIIYYYYFLIHILSILFTLTHLIM